MKGKPLIGAATSAGMARAVGASGLAQATSQTRTQTQVETQVQTQRHKAWRVGS